MTKEEIILQGIDKKELVLEIGASFRPLVSKKEGYTVETAYWSDENQLWKDYKDYAESIDAIEKVDYLCKGGSYYELIGKEKYYDYIIASHLIERTTNLVGCLNDCAKLLNDTGVIRLIVPDKRYCFDHFRDVTNTGRVVDDYFQGNDNHSPGVIADYFLNVTQFCGNIAWSNKDYSAYSGDAFGKSYTFVHTLEQTKEEVKNWINGVYQDIHHYVFTPASFELLVYDLRLLGYINLSIEKLYETEGHEFFVFLKKSTKPVIYDAEYRKELLKKVNAETSLNDKSSIYSLSEIGISYNSEEMKLLNDDIGKKVGVKNALQILFKSLSYYLPKIPKKLRSMTQYGFRYALKGLMQKKQNSNPSALEAVALRAKYTKEELEAQKKNKFDQDITFSILVPLYNTPKKFLKEMIESVISQTYSNWELCLVDGSDEGHQYVKRICTQYGKGDARIRYQKLEKNLGISDNTNACIDMATGDYIGLFDHDDILHPAALYEVMKAICEQGADFIYTDEATFQSPNVEHLVLAHFKPDYAPDTLRANNYICHFTVFKKKLLETVGKFRSEYDGSQDFDMILRLTEQAKNIVHIPKILYYWRAHRDSVAESVGAKQYAITAGHRALKDHLKRVGLKGDVLNTVAPTIYRVSYVIKGQPLISIIIPNKDHGDDLKLCIHSILEKTTYPNFEIIIAENNSVEAATFDFYETLKEDKRIKIVTWEGEFNYSAIMNFAVTFAKGDYYLLLNNDVEVISPEWIEEMLMYAQRDDVGAVGAKLYYHNDSIQHAGVILGINGVASHSHTHFDRKEVGYMGRLIYSQNLSAVTFACAMLPRHVWEELGGLDESFEVNFNDVDLCMRIRDAGYLIIWTPYAELYHYESKSRGYIYYYTVEQNKQFEREVLLFQSRWSKELAAGDPYYNPNLTMRRDDFSYKNFNE